MVKRTLTVLSEAAAFSMAFESENFDCRPYNGYTLFRPIFDRWYADRAVDAGATLLTGCLAEDVVLQNASITGIRIGRSKGQVHAPVTILCDGVLSLLARRLGLSKPAEAHDMALGIRALFRLREEEIDERFGLARRQGASHEFLGCTEGIRGGGFVYTQTETLSVGLVIHLDSLKGSRKAPYDLFQRFSGPRAAVSKLLKGARLVEYSAHVLPEGGYRLVPQLFGTRAAPCGRRGRPLLHERAQPGRDEPRHDLRFLRGGDRDRSLVRRGISRRGSLPGTRARLKESFVLKDMRTFAGAAGTHAQRSALLGLSQPRGDRSWRSSTGPTGRPKKGHGQGCLGRGAGGGSPSDTSSRMH